MCNREGHLKRNCPRWDNIKCYNCNKFGRHFANKCTEISSKEAYEKHTVWN
ncbi:hypothetical protein DM01DRAFT_1340209, partial [Hesseltinella vesiculosa]